MKWGRIFDDGIIYKVIEIPTGKRLLVLLVMKGQYYLEKRNND